MSQDKQEKTVETTTPPAPEELNTQEESNEKVDETTESVASTEETNEIDYEAELTKAKKQLGKAEFTIEELRRQGKKPAEETPGESELTVEELTKQIDSKVEQRLKAFQGEQVRDLVDASLESLTDNPKERELIKFHYENSLNHSGYTRASIKADLENARLLANRSKLLAENRELKEALKSKGSISNSGRGSNQDKIVTEDEPILTPEERTLLKRRADKEGISLKEYIRRNKTKLTT
jgi:hypothetical protein